MKSMLSTTVLIAALFTATNAWIFDACGVQVCNKGDIIEFDVGILESCTLRLYDDANCHVQTGISSRNWDHVLTRTIRAFDIRDC
ncbi:hypothetical protein B0H19DRAFT_1255733 [Mycena capillaripes]|nr:hypothetical protein B0H19DRAFT_1255733 [Mycena capillaripes]